MHDETAAVRSLFRLITIESRKMIYKPTDNQLMLNRELGLLEFNRRVLAQAEDPRNPLLERLTWFLCIVSSNLDEFFEVRVCRAEEHDPARSQGHVA